MKCPRCSAAVATSPDASGLFVCSGCGIKLKRVPPAAKTDVAARVEASAAPAALAEGEALDTDKLLARLDAPASPSATLPPGTPRKPIARPEEPPRADVIAKILFELQAVRRTQERILSLLQARPAPAAAQDAAEPENPLLAEPPREAPSTALRSRRRKSVLLIDDDPATRQAALEALERAEIPVRTASEGNVGLAAIAQERPDVIVLELDVGGPMPGKDVINLIKATMSWVDIPIVLFTRLPVSDQKEARTIHGADELVHKSAPGCAETLAATIVALFRRV